MKFPSRFSIPVLALAGCFTVATASAQNAPAKEKLVDFKDLKIAVQKTPDFTLKGGTTDKRFRAKDWIEIEPKFKVARPQGAGSKKAEVIPELTFKYYVYLNSSVKENARILTGEVVHVNVPIDEESYSVMYISPSSVLRVTGKPEGNPQLVVAYAVEVTSGGNVVGFISKSSAGTSTNPSDKTAKWWDATTAPPKDEGGLLNKVQSPFAPLWADYYADIKGVK